MKMKKRGCFCKKFLRVGAVLVIEALFFLTFSIHTVAETSEELFAAQREASGADEFWNQMPEEIRRQLQGLGINGIDMESISTLRPNEVGSSLWEIVLAEANGPMKMGGALMGVLAFCALADGMRTLGDRTSVSPIFQATAGLSVCGTILLPLLSCVDRVREAVDGCTTLMGTFVPVYAAVLTASGNVTSALSYQSIVLWVSELFTVLIHEWITPVLTVALALGVVGNVGVPWKLSAVSDGINKGCAWGLGLIGTIFTGLLSVQSTVGAAADSLSVKAIRFSVSNLVPVVGGAIGDALGTIRGCLTLLKSTLGGIGIISAAILLLPSIASCLWWIVSMSLCAAAADMLMIKNIAALLRTAVGTVKTLIAVLSTCGLFVIVATAIVSKIGTGSVQ